MSNTLEIGKKLVELCKKNQNVEAVKDLYADDIVSIEAQAHAEMPKRQEGKPAILKKNEWFMANHEIHKQDADGPWPKDDQFVVVFSIDLTAKAGPMSGKRMQMKEAALYTVKNGKITQEEFFYGPE